jgi:hypothetical protein
MFKNRENILKLIEQDIADGSHCTFNTLAKRLNFNEKIVQTDITTGFIRKKIFRVHLHAFSDNHQRDLSIWEVDSHGSPKSGIYTIFSYLETNKPVTRIEGSSPGNMDGGDLEIKPRQLSRQLNQALRGIKHHNFQRVV